MESIKANQDKKVLDMDLMDLDSFNYNITKVYYGSENTNNAILQFIDRTKR